MRILVTGSSGLIGSSLVAALAVAGHEVIQLVRSRADPGRNDIVWNPVSDSPPQLPAQGIDAVVHLAGENIAGGRWTARRKAAIRDSRVRGTALLCRALRALARPPAVLVSASAVGYYGDRGGEILSEQSPPGSGFLSSVCCEWEEATAPAADRGIRVVNLRAGMVLSARGGALAKILPVFRLGLGGPLGSGNQYLSWIGLEDHVAVIQHCLARMELRGAVISASPNPVTNRDYTATLGKVLRRPAFMRMPAFAARLVFGEMADELLLASQRVEPVRLQSSGYTFRHPGLEDAFRHILTP